MLMGTLDCGILVLSQAESCELVRGLIGLDE